MFFFFFFLANGWNNKEKPQNQQPKPAAIE